VNDGPEEAEELARLLDSRTFKVNLIPYNPTGLDQKGTDRAGIERFRRALQRAGIPATIRLTRGREIAAACGQLAAAPRTAVRA
jgi:23S rRNA (adenine2503-C2)-methyltransferase